MSQPSPPLLPSRVSHRASVPAAADAADAAAVPSTKTVVSNAAKHRQKARHNRTAKPPPPPPPPPPSSIPNSRCRAVESITKNVSLSSVLSLPLPFPRHLPRPATGFLRNEAPYKESFAAALQTSYLGLAVDESVAIQQNAHSPTKDNEPLITEAQLQSTLQNEMADYFGTDVTQPFGLGTPCAKTYVTRCLLGDVGTTYKYLGLRMFAHAWPAHISALRDTLQQRVADIHLPELQRQRHQVLQQQQQEAYSTDATESSIPLVRGRAQFDVCLVNRMTSQHPHLKVDGIDASCRTTVSWHADSSLEHYSTIAVYQTLIPTSSSSTSNNNNNSSSSRKGTTAPTPTDSTATIGTQWSVALRVSPHAEGPTSTSLKSNSSDNNNDGNTESAPPIAISLPSNSAYYLLDDFNHHHQHTVLVSNNAASAGSRVPSKKRKKGARDSQSTATTASNDWIRYSLTFRLLRESHNVAHILQRCERAVVASLHKPKSSKGIRSLQLLLTEVETEWLRQFYIQGRHHYNVLWPTWGNAMQQLWQYWSRLEERTLHIVTWLEHAAQGQCQSQSATDTVVAKDTASPTGTTLSKAQRKLRDKRRKAASTLREMLERESGSAARGSSPQSVPDAGRTGSVFESLASLLEARATMRELWMRRESDVAFVDLPADCHPLPFPCRFASTSTTQLHSTDSSNLHDDDDVLGISPMPGMPSELRQLAVDVRAYERAFASGREADLPRPIHAVNAKSGADIGLDGGCNRTGNATMNHVTTDQHSMDCDWIGWGQSGATQFGLEMQSPWAEALLEGRKSIETRSYNLPPALIGQRIAILQSPRGTAGISALGNTISLTEKPPVVAIVGWCTFSSVKVYTSSREFQADSLHHLVSAGSGFGWKDGTTSVLYGWVVQAYGKSTTSMYQSATRRMRSLYELHPSGESSGTCKQQKPPPPPPPLLKKKKGKQASRQGPAAGARKKRRF
jgi:FTO catalytic domain/FTO C-terminal domain